MRIRRVEVHAFGRLENRCSGDAPMGGLVVIEGRNEAGKSTLFEFLGSMLYGLYPTALDRHPYAPWTGAEMGGTAWIGLGDEEVSVTRRLLSSPIGTLTRDGRAEAIRNDTLDFVDHVPRKVFREVFALSLSELAGLDDAGWEAVEDRILGRLGATDLRPAREVAAELENEARSLWRPDRRGSPKVRLLDEEIRAVSARRPIARGRAEERRAATDRLQELERLLESARSTRADEQRRLERLRQLVPLRRERSAIRRLRERAGESARLSGLPADPVAELARRRERVAEAEAAVAAARDEIAGLEVDVDAFTMTHRVVLEREAEIDALRARTAGAEPRRIRLAAIEQEIRGLDRRLDDEADRLTWRGSQDPTAVASIPAAPLAEAWTRWTEARRELAEAPPAPSPSVPDSPALRRLGVAALALALTVLVVAIAALADAPALSDLPPLAAGALCAFALAVAGGAGALLRIDRRTRGAARRARTAASESLARCREAEEVARLVLESLLAQAGVELDPALDDLPERVRRCRQWVRDRTERHLEAESLRHELAALDRDAEAFDEIADSEVGPAALGNLLQERLREARDRSIAARKAESRIAHLDTVVSDAEARLAGAREALDTLLERLRPFDPDPDTAAEEAARALEHSREADTREERLRADLPDLAALEQEIDRAEAAGEPWLTDSDPVAALQESVDRRTSTIEGWLAEVTTLQERIAANRDAETLDDLEGELARLRAERARLRREHDRLWVLSRLVDDADRKVRELHQPEILRLAGEHLVPLTEGRYDRLEVADDRRRSLQVSGPAAPEPLEVASPLSTGTREQIYLALRMALVRHLDEGGTRLPLFLDEILVNWDPYRRDRGLDLIEAMARERQVFLFTCHPKMVELMVARGASHWRLGPT